MEETGELLPSQLSEPSQPDKQENPLARPPGEILRTNLEGQIRVARDFRNILTKMEIPTAKDSDEVIDQDRAQFTQLYQQAEAVVPNAVEAYSRYKELNQLIRVPNISIEESNKYIAARNLLSKDPDVAFLVSIEEAAQDILAKRTRIRGILKTLGDGINDPSRIEEVFDENEQVRLSELAGNIQDIIVHTASISLITDKETYDTMAPPDSFAHHIPSTIWNVALSEDALEESQDERQAFTPLSRAAIFSAFFEEDHSNILDHENWHALLEGFHFTDQYDYSMVVLNVRNLAKLQNGEEMPFEIRASGVKDREAAIANLRERITAQLSNLTDRFQEELAIDVLRGNFFPDQAGRRCHNLLNYHKQAILRDISSERINVDPAITPDIEALRQPDDTFVRISKLFERIGKDAPQRREELDALFLLYPPSKIDTMETIVNSWSGDKKS